MAGAFTIVWSAVIFYVIPETPQASHRWFNDDERALLDERSHRSMVGAAGPSTFKWAQAKEAGKDLKIYLFLLMGASIYVCNGECPRVMFGSRLADELRTFQVVSPPLELASYLRSDTAHSRQS